MCVCTPSAYLPPPATVPHEHDHGNRECKRGHENEQRHSRGNADAVTQDTDHLGQQDAAERGNSGEHRHRNRAGPHERTGGRKCCRIAARHEESNDRDRECRKARRVRCNHQDRRRQNTAEQDENDRELVTAGTERCNEHTSQHDHHPGDGDHERRE